MQIETSQTYSLLMSAQGARVASGDVSEKEETTQQSSAITAARQTEGTDNTTTGITTSRIASETNKALLEQQEVGESTHTPVKEEISRDTSWFESLNFVSESDRKLLSAMTGYNVDSIGRFTDKNGEPAYPEDLTQHSLRTFQMELLSARRGDSPDSIAGENITEAEFIRLINKSRAVASSMGEVFNEELLEKGLAYLARSNA